MESYTLGSRPQTDLVTINSGPSMKVATYLPTPEFNVAPAKIRLCRAKPRNSSSILTEWPHANAASYSGHTSTSHFFRTRREMSTLFSETCAAGDWGAFIEAYNREWLIERHGNRTPAAVRQALTREAA